MKVKYIPLRINSADKKERKAARAAAHYFVERMKGTPIAKQVAEILKNSNGTTEEPNKQEGTK